MSLLLAGLSKAIPIAGDLFGTGFNIASSITSANQARKQKQYFQDIAQEYNAQYQKSRAIKVRTQKLEQGQYIQSGIDAGIETNNQSVSFTAGQNNLQQVQREELQQMDFENRMQQLGFQRQIINAEQMAKNYTMVAIGQGVNAGLGAIGTGVDIYSAYSQYSDWMSGQKQIGLNSAMKAQGGTGFQSNQYSF